MFGPRHFVTLVTPPRSVLRSTLRKPAAFTLVELLVVLAIVGLLVAILLPAVQAARESSRRAKCLSNLHQLGLGLANFQNTFGTLPPASQIRVAGGPRRETWSWLVLLLPYIEQAPLYDAMEVEINEPLSGWGLGESVVAGNTSFPFFRCPSYGGPAFADMQFQIGALTNYKALAATHLASLDCAIPGRVGYPLYGQPADHPDGALFPAETGPRLSEFRDGASHTAVATETCEQDHAHWVFGNQASLAGLPTFGPGAVRFIPSPAGHIQPVPPAGGAAVDLRTYLSYPYSTTNRYSSWAIRGPGSHHSAVVNHLLADGSVQGISRSVDPAVYMYLLTRNGNDPAGTGL